MGLLVIVAMQADRNEKWFEKIKIAIDQQLVASVCTPRQSGQNHLQGYLMN